MESQPFSNYLTPVDPARPLAPYIGGKRAMARRLITMINAVPHNAYCEPFVGMGGVFFRRDQRPKSEVINDWSYDVANLFRILQRHYQSFLEELKWKLYSRAEFDRLMAEDVATLTDIERAARFLYLQRSAFGGNVTKRHFAMTKGTPSRFDLTRLVPMLEEVHERLTGVTIERLDYMEFINRYDRPGTLFFIDPPYMGTEHYYGAGMFSVDQFQLLADRLGQLQGRFILTINDLPETRAIFAPFKIQSEDLFYTASQTATAAKELIVSN